MNTSFAIDVDADLIAQAAKGCTGSCEQIYRLFQRPVYTLAYRFMQCPDDAHEVVQDVFIKALSKLDRYRGDAPFWGWLRQVAVNTALSALRKRGRRKGEMSMSDLLENQLPSHVSQTSHGIDLHQAYSQLPATTRAVIWLHDVEGYTHAEIGKMMSRSTSFSKSQVARGHAAMRSGLEYEAGFDLCPQTT